MTRSQIVVALAILHILTFRYVSVNQFFETVIQDLVFFLSSAISVEAASKFVFPGQKVFN